MWDFGGYENNLAEYYTDFSYSVGTWGPVYVFILRYKYTCIYIYRGMCLFIDMSIYIGMYLYIGICVSISLSLYNYIYI